MHLRTTGEGYIGVSFHYSQRIVELIKGYIPASYRGYDPATHEWFVSPLAIDQMREFLRSSGYGSLEIDMDRHMAAERVSMRIANAQPVFLSINPVKDRGTEQTSYSPALDGTMYILPLEVLKAAIEGLPAKSLDVSGIQLDTSTYYAILGVPQKAAGTDISVAYKRLARLYHPDVNADPGAHNAFVTVKGAYDVLSDPARRRKYDFALSSLGAAATQKQAPKTPAVKFGWIYEDNAAVVYSPTIGPSVVTCTAYELFQGRYYVTHIQSIQPWSPMP